MEVGCVVIELKPDSKKRVDQWASFILSKKDEALETLKNEGVTIESYFFVNIEGKDYLIGYMRAKSMKYAQEAVKKSLSEIDAYHQQFKKDCWEKAIKTQPILELNRIVGEENMV